MSRKSERALAGPLLAGLLCLVAAALQNRPLVDRRAAERPAIDPLENAPPLIVFTTVVLGGFRGVLADSLWLRVSYLQDQGRYLEIAQLSDWITKLDPRSSDIWAFHAWNMAYNISAMMGTPEDRWRWVSSGIRLLRDEGLRYNPDDSELYWELGWMYQNKLGADLDPAGGFYRREFALQMARGFPAGRFDPNLPSTDESRRAMTRDFRLDPATVADVDARYGPFDWRLPEPHAIYWACRGRRVEQPTHRLSLDRMIFQSMAALVWRGHLTFDPAAKRYRRAPDLNLLPKALAVYEDAVRHYDAEAVKTAYANFMRHAVWLLHDQNEDEQARRLFDTLRAKFPSSETDAGFEVFVRQGEANRDTGP